MNVKHVASRLFQPGGGPSRGLFRDYENFADGSVAALSSSHKLHGCTGAAATRLQNTLPTPPLAINSNSNPLIIYQAASEHEVIQSQGAPGFESVFYFFFMMIFRHYFDSLQCNGFEE